MPNEAGLKVDPFALALIVLLFAEHLLFGANRQDLGLVFAVLHLILLLALIAASRGAEPPRLPLRAPAALMAGVFFLGGLSILPLGPPLAHPLWTYVQAIEPGAAASISLDPASTRVQLVKLAGFCALFLTGAALGSRREGAEAAIRCLTLAGILYCAWAAVAFAIDPKTIFGVPRPYSQDRLSGSFLSPNTAGTLFACLTVMALCGLMRPLLRERRAGEAIRPAELVGLWPQGLLAFLSFACLLLSASRGGLLALAAAVLFAIALAIWMKSSKRSLTGGFLTVVCLGLAAGLALFVLGGNHAAERLADTNPLTEDRLRVFAAYWPAIKASPWLGYGLGAFAAFNAASMTPENALALADLGAAHNVYLQWMLQEGAPGALCLFAAVALVFGATVKGVTRRSSQQGLGLACLCAAVVFAVHGLVDYALEVPSMAAFFSALLGLGYGLAERPSGRRIR